MTKKYKAELCETKFVVFTGIPECFLGNWLDDRRDKWNASVTEMLNDIPNVNEISVYGEYSVTLEYNSEEEIPEDPVAHVQQYINKWVPPFEYTP